LAGAVARGAYEAGALTDILTHPNTGLNSLGSTFFLGTSSGAINALLWGIEATPGKSLANAGRAVEGTWLGIRPRNVFRRPLDPHNWVPSLRAAFGLKDVYDLLDTTPLLETVTAHMQQPPNAIAANIAAGSVEGVGAVATYFPGAASSGRTRIFWESNIPAPAGARGAIDFMATPLEPEHVVASSAVPALFPARQVTKPPGAKGWYLDGGVRLNTPLKPAIDLGADRIIVVSSFAAEYPPLPSGPPPARRQPNVAEAAALSLHAVLGDGLIEDLARLRHVNALVGHNGAHNPKGHRVIPHMVVAPRNGVLSKLARQHFKAAPLSLYWVIDRLLTHNDELLSYLYFNKGYFNAQFRQARKDAAPVLAAGWKV
jgi:NTE family protein